MKVFKFGGASVKDAQAVKNLGTIVKHYGSNDTLIVVSAMGKTTNALEAVVNQYANGGEGLQAALQVVKQYHKQIILELFLSEEHPAMLQFEITYKALLQFLETNTNTNYDFIYDQIIHYGELFSTQIIGHFLNQIDLEVSWLDARNYIKTNANYRRALVDMQVTERLILPLAETGKLMVTQGFIASNAEGFTTTLGREGSDYTAAIFGACLQAESVTIWKDVPGVLNADPRYFDSPELLERMSYNEAIELAFYGASVMHPKTLQPLQQKAIPLHVKSFLNPDGVGTVVHVQAGIHPQVPCYIVKKNQVLIQLSSLDFSYIVEENIGDIFRLLHHFKMKVDVIQNSAITFSVCVDDLYNTLQDVVAHLQQKFKVQYTTNVALYTVRHYNAQAIALIESNKTILLKQRSQDTLQIVTQ